MSFSLNFSFLVMLSFVFISCSSKPAIKEQIKDQDISGALKKEYTVTDASSGIRPGWIVDAAAWAQDQKLNTDDFLYFSFETTPRQNKEISCDVAKANSRAEIASLLATFIQKSLSQTTEGQDIIDPKIGTTDPLRSYVESNLTEKVQEVVVGSLVLKTHWEKRFYQKKLGAESDYRGFTCATLVQIKKDQIEEAMNLIKRELMGRTNNPDLKKKVKVALEEAKENFETMRGLPTTKKENESKESKESKDTKVSKESKEEVKTNKSIEE